MKLKHKLPYAYLLAEVLSFVIPDEIFSSGITNEKASTSKKSYADDI